MTLIKIDFTPLVHVFSIHIDIILSLAGPSLCEFTLPVGAPGPAIATLELGPDQNRIPEPSESSHAAFVRPIVAVQPNRPVAAITVPLPDPRDPRSMSMYTTAVHRIARSTNIHGHSHTCWRPGFPKCRLGYPIPCCNEPIPTRWRRLVV